MQKSYRVLPEIKTFIVLKVFTCETVCVWMPNALSYTRRIVMKKSRIPCEPNKLYFQTDFVKYNNNNRLIHIQIAKNDKFPKL